MQHRWATQCAAMCSLLTTHSPPASMLLALACTPVVATTYRPPPIDSPGTSSAAAAAAGAPAAGGAGGPTGPGGGAGTVAGGEVGRALACCRPRPDPRPLNCCCCCCWSVLGGGGRGGSGLGGSGGGGLGGGLARGGGGRGLGDGLGGGCNCCSRCAGGGSLPLAGIARAGSEAAVAASAWGLSDDSDATCGCQMHLQARRPCKLVGPVGKAWPARIEGGGHTTVMQQPLNRKSNLAYWPALAPILPVSHPQPLAKPEAGVSKEQVAGPQGAPWLAVAPLEHHAAGRGSRRRG